MRPWPRAALAALAVLPLAACFDPDEPQGPRFSCPVVRVVAGLELLPYQAVAQDGPVTAELRVIDAICTYDDSTETFLVTSTVTVLIDRTAGTEGVVIPYVIAIDSPTGMQVEQEVAAFIAPGSNGLQETFQQEVQGIGGPGGAGSTILFALQPDEQALDRLDDAVPRPAG